MDRRDFVKAAALATMPMILKSCNWPGSEGSYDIVVDSDAQTGHLVYKSGKFERLPVIQTEYLIVGGGVAGMTAAAQLQGKDFLLCELSNSLGGSSSAARFEGMYLSQGAHYDLSYPRGYGEEVLGFLENLGVIQYQHWRDSWGFTDQQHIILHRKKNQCFDHGEYRKDVLGEGETKDKFLEILSAYSGKMHLPSRLIEEKFHHLNAETFLGFLKKHLPMDDTFVRGLDYHMKDDYGTGCAEVSALAGIHYFMCRPYYKEIMELFSPPEGNQYFINKMAERTGAERLLTNHLVKNIREEKEGFMVHVVDVKNQQVKPVKADKVIYAGQKHALKYIYPAGYDLFRQNTSAPWLVVNVVTDNTLPLPAFWQNEMLTEDTSFMGFVDSASQFTGQSRYRVFTAYYCLPVGSRDDLLQVEKEKKTIAQSTVRHVGDYFRKDISGYVKQVFIKAMGHAMPIPGPGYLFDDKNQYRTNKQLAYAGVDNSRLPLFYEAVDSGLEAVKILAQV
ncbi:MAG: FAD-dependent oxidoreductase [Cyclobacteriaceae bacterium]